MKTYQISYYNLDMIISVGYRVNTQLSPVELHFIDNFERERKKLKKQ